MTKEEYEKRHERLEKMLEEQVQLLSERSKRCPDSELSEITSAMIQTVGFLEDRNY